MYVYAIECMVAYLDIELVPTQDVLKKNEASKPTGEPAERLSSLATHRPKQKRPYFLTDFPAHLTHATNHKRPGRADKTAPQDTVPNSGNRDDQPTHSSSKGCRVTLVHPPDTCGGVGAEPWGCCIWSRIFPNFQPSPPVLVVWWKGKVQQFVPCLPRFVVSVGKQIHTHTHYGREVE